MRQLKPIIILAISIGLFFLYTNKNYTEIKAKKETITSLDQALDKSGQILKKREELQSKYNTIPIDDIQALNKLLPDGVDNVQLVLDINGIAKKYGMSLRSIKVDTEDKTAQANKKTVIAEENKVDSSLLSFQVTGTYENFYSFLEDVEKSLRIVDVVNLNFRSNDKGVYDYSVTIKTYWLK